MRIRITKSSDSRWTTIEIEGRLGADEADELLKEGRAAGRPLRLALAGLRSADDAGIKALRSLKADGAELIGATAYVQLLLKANTTAPNGRDNP